MAIERTELEGEEVVEESSDASEISHLPMSFLGGKKVSPGDVIRVEVVETDEDGGFVKVKYATAKAPKTSAIEEASMAFNPSKNMEVM
jgi:hypothetical protein